MKDYIAGLCRFFRDKWGYDFSLFDEDHEIFGNVKVGLWNTIDNRSRTLQGKGKVRRPHNVMSAADVRKLYESPELSENTPCLFQCHLTFAWLC